MRDLTEAETAMVKKFTNLLIECDAPILCESLEKVMWGYALYMLKDEDICGHPDNVYALYWVRDMRDILNTKE